MSEDLTRGDVQSDSAPGDLTPVAPQTIQAADDKWNEVMGDDGESFADMIAGGTPDETPVAPVAAEPELVKTETQPAVDTPTPVAAEAPATQIDASLISLAVEMGADQAELDDLVKSDPAAATELLTKIQAEYNSQTLGLLHGSPSAEERSERLVSPASEDEATQAKSTLEALLTDDDAKAAAIEQYGEDFVEKVLTPLARRDAENSKREAKLDILFEQMEAAQQQATIAELEATFLGFGPGYKDFYGSGAENLSDDQFTNRTSVGRIADKLRAGDRVTGTPDRGAGHYLTRAHHIVAADQRQAAVRKDLISQIKTRSRGSVAKPSGQTTRIVSGEKSEGGAGQALDRKIANLGLEQYFDD